MINDETLVLSPDALSAFAKNKNVVLSYVYSRN